MDTTVLGWLILAAKYGPQIAGLVKAGLPVGQAIYEHTPDLWAAIKKFFPEPAAAETVGKLIFVPHMTTEAERAWFDRASFSTGQ